MSNIDPSQPERISPQQQVANYILGIDSHEVSGAEQRIYEVSSVRISLPGREAVVDLARYERLTDEAGAQSNKYTKTGYLPVAIPMGKDAAFDGQAIEVAIYNQEEKRYDFHAVRDLEGEALTAARDFLEGFSASNARPRIALRDLRIDSETVLRGGLLRRPDGSLVEIASAEATDLPFLQAASQMVAESPVLAQFAESSQIRYAIEDQAKSIAFSAEYVQPVSHVEAMIKEASARIDWAAAVKRQDIQEALGSVAGSKAGQTLRDFLSRCVILNSAYRVRSALETLNDEREVQGQPPIDGDHALIFQEPDGWTLDRLQPKHYAGGSVRGFGVASSRGVFGELPFWTDGAVQNVVFNVTAPDLRLTAQDAATGSAALEGYADEQRIRQFSPLFSFDVTDSQDGSYRVYLTNDGVLVQCSPESQPVFYRVGASMHAIAVRKPVIYLYPAHPQDVTVTLDYDGTLANTYPKINGNQWRVHALPDGTLSDGTRQYKYLFWDGMSRHVDWDWSSGFYVEAADVESFLEEKTALLGLNFAESQDFITYWAPLMKQNARTFVTFQTERYESLAKLHVNPMPDAVIRVFMVFKKVDSDPHAPEPHLEKIERKGFTVVEWGGTNADEAPAASAIHLS